MRIVIFILLSQICLFPAYAQKQDTITVIAEKGDGIFSLLRKNGLEPKEYLSDFVNLNKDALGEDSVLKMGIPYFLPPTKKPEIEKRATKVLIEPIFGKDHEAVTIQDSLLKGAVYYLIAGHGGPDPGAIGPYGSYRLSEDEYAYDVTLRLAKNLMQRGAEIHLIVKDKNDGIRDDPILLLDDDETSYDGESIPYNQKARLRQRTRVVNNLYGIKKGKYQRLITIHLDSRSIGENIDVFFYHHHRSKSGERLARNIHKTFASKYAEHQPGRNYFGTVSSRSSLYVIRNTIPPTVFIELGNIRNTQDQRRFVLHNNRQALANWITEGIIKDFTEKDQ